MNRESDEDCLALIASIRDSHDRAMGRPQWPEIERLLVNLEARIAADCPCGTETCRENWRELRQAQAAQPLPDIPGAYRATMPDGRVMQGIEDVRPRKIEQQAKADEEEPALPVAGAATAIRFREIIREEALAAVSVVWKDAVRHELAGPILERRIAEVGVKEAIREEVANEVQGELGSVWRALTVLEQRIARKLRAALEAKDS